MGKLLYKEGKLKIEKNLKDAPKPVPRFSNVNMQQRLLLYNLRSGPKPPPPLPQEDDFDLPSPANGETDEYGNRLFPLPMLF